MKLSGNVLGMKRMKTDGFDHVFAHSCPGMPIIQDQIRPYLSQNIPFSIYLEVDSSDFDETLRKCSWYEKNEE